MKSLKLVQIVITDDSETANKTGERLIFDVYRSVTSAVQFLNELGIAVKRGTLNRITEFSNTEIKYEVPQDYQEKLMRLCPINRRVSLNEALDNQTAHIGILPMADVF
jgi:hypothetical protein